MPSPYLLHFLLLTIIGGPLMVTIEAVGADNLRVATQGGTLTLFLVALLALNARRPVPAKK